MSRQAKFRLVTILLFAALGTLLGEVGLRLLRPEQTAATIREQPGVHRRSDYLTFSLQPGAEMKSSSPGEYDVTYRVNAQGFRSARQYGPLPTTGTPRYLALGDSFTFGQGVTQEEAWPAALEVRLSREERAGAEVINAAYACGFSPDTYALYYRREGRALRAATVIVALFSWNDIDDIGNNDWYDLGPDGMPSRITSRVNYVDASGRRLRDELYPLRLRLPFLRDSHLFQLAARSTKLELLNGPNLRRYIPYTREAHRKDLAPALVEPFERFQRSLRALRDDVAADGARLLVVIIPSIVQLAPDDAGLRASYSVSPPEAFDASQPDRRMSEALHTLGVRHLALLDPLAQRIKDGRERLSDLYFRRDGHFTARGHALAAELIHEALGRER